jgi:hypothetical protein
MAARRVDAPPAGWGALLRDDPGAGPSHRPALWSAIAATVPGMRAAFLAAEDGGVLVGGAPLIVERRGPLEWLHALPWGLSGAPLARAGHHAAVDAAVAGALATLKRELHAAGGGWSLYRPVDAPLAPGAIEEPGGETRVLEASLVDLVPGGIEAAWRRVDRKTRQDLRHAREAGLAFAEDPGAIEAAYALHVAQGRAWRNHRPLPLELSRRLLAARDADGPAARLFTLRDARGVVAALLALDHPREILPWWSGLHPGARQRHASGLLLWSVVEWAAQHGRERVNLGGSAGIDPLASFKASLGARPVRYPVRWLDARDAPLAGRIAAALRRRLRGGRRRGEAA